MNYLHTPTLTPATIGNIRQQHPQVSVPEGADLSDLGYAPLTLTEPPTPPEWHTVEPGEPEQEQGNTTVTVCRSGGAWLIQSRRKVLGKLHIKTRVGFEVDNVFCGDYDPQMWYPIDGYELRAPATWSVLPGR